VATKARLAANNIKLERMVQNASSAAARAKAIARLNGPQPTGIPLIQNAANVANNAANAAAVSRANSLRGVAAPQPKRANLLREVAAPRSSGLLRVAGEPKQKTLIERAANLKRTKNAQRNTRRREAALGSLPIFPRYNFGGRAVI
jgi:hypothetical protein